jgi:hypothetical protein
MVDEQASRASAAMVARPHINNEEVNQLVHETYEFGSPMYQTGANPIEAMLYAFPEEGFFHWIEPGYEGAISEWQVWGLPWPSRAAPANARFRRRVQELVSWREVLEANGYAIVIHSDRDSLVTAKGIKRRARVMNNGQPNESFTLKCINHEERSGSMVLRSNRLFHCFGCNADGHIVDFVASLNHLRSAQAIKQYFADTFPQMQPRNA